MDLQKKLLSSIPQVDLLMRQPLLKQAEKRYGRAQVLAVTRAQLDALRAALLKGDCKTAPSTEELCRAIDHQLERQEKPALFRVLNATGVALHTNLGRAPLADEAVKAIEAVAAGYCNLEYDVENGGRGSRNHLVEPLLCEICGSEAAMVVNNNAAALLLALSTLSFGKEIPVSRGELVEIGDSFRLPDIMAQSGGTLVEVGTTNKTRLSDYEDVLQSKNTGLVLKVHTSNYRVVGFTDGVGVSELSRLAKSYSVPLVVDLGSGAMLEAPEYPFADEPTVPQTLRDGADLVCFSTDKLLGGPQAGILLGGRELIDRMRRNPLARALRIDKLSLAALEATLRCYRDPARAKRCVPVLRMLCASGQELREKADTLCQILGQSAAGAEFAVLPVKRPVGGGSAPGQELDSFAVSVLPATMPVSVLEERLRHAEVPIIARIASGRLLFDISTLAAADFPYIVNQTAQLLKEQTP